MAVMTVETMTLTMLITMMMQGLGKPVGDWEGIVGRKRSPESVLCVIMMGKDIDGHAEAVCTTLLL